MIKLKLKYGGQHYNSENIISAPNYAICITGFGNFSCQCIWPLLKQWLQSPSNPFLQLSPTSPHPYPIPSLPTTFSGFPSPGMLGIRKFSSHHWREFTQKSLEDPHSLYLLNNDKVERIYFQMLAAAGNNFYSVFQGNLRGEYTKNRGY